MKPFAHDLRAAVVEVGRRCGVSVEDAELVREHSNAIVALPRAGLLVRVAGNPAALERIRRSVSVTRWLAGRGYPCVAPVGVEPFMAAGRPVSVWRLLDVADGPLGTGAELGGLLRALHEQPAPPFPLGDIDPLAGVRQAVESAAGGLDEADRAWLRGRVGELAAAWERCRPALPYGLIHGDAHAGNLLRLRGGGVVLADWDHTANGPREWDLIQLPYLSRRFGRYGAEDVAEFSTVYGWDVREWGGYENLIEIREVSGLSPYARGAASDRWMRRELAYRIATLRDQDEDARWNSPSDR
jgi:phosphotransferase family enzyme